MNGFFNIYKPAGMSSAAVVAVMKHLTGEKRTGHAGTLDPEAAGVLPIMTGKATRLFDYLVDKEKEYEAVCAFGTSTDTQDATGEVLETGENYPDLTLIREKAGELTGTIRQRPSMYSAIKVNGKPLYARARKGETVEVPERTVEVHSIEVTGEEPDHGISLRIRCGRGTYIRTLCDDLGKKCGCPAHMRSLVRTRSGMFTADTALDLEEARRLAAEGKLADRMMPPDAPLEHLRSVELPLITAKQVQAGAKIPAGVLTKAIPEEENIRVYLEGAFWGIMRRAGDLLVWKVQIAPETGSKRYIFMQVIWDRGTGGERVLALGTFDGVHRGHQELLAVGKRYAQEHGILLRACSFDRHPLEVLRPELAPEPLTSLGERAKLMERYGADELQLLPFTREMADMNPKDFLRMLRETVTLRAVVAGWNYTFGKGGKGNAETLCEDGKQYGYEVLIVPPVKTGDGEIISSTLIREKLREGRREEAEELLGHLLEQPDPEPGRE